MVINNTMFINAEDVLGKQLDASVDKLRETKGMAKCEAHDALVENAILQTQTLTIFLSWIKSPLVKIVIAIVTLGGGSAILLAAAKVLMVMSGIHPTMALQ